jgi:hypothetical protein
VSRANLKVALYDAGSEQSVKVAEAVSESSPLLVIEPQILAFLRSIGPVYPSLREFHSGNGAQFPLRTNGAQ